MNRLIYLLPLLIFISPAFAQVDTESEITTEDEIVAGMTPENPLYFFDKLFDDFRLGLADRNSVNFSKIGLEIADERLAEGTVLELKQKFELAKQSHDDHKDKLKSVEENLEKIKSEDNVQVLKDKIEIEQRIKDHSDKVTEIKSRILIKMSGNISVEQLEHIKSVFAGIIEKAEDMEIKIKIERESTEEKLEKHDKLTRSAIDLIKREKIHEVEVEVENEESTLVAKIKERGDSESDSSESDSSESDSSESSGSNSDSSKRG